MNFLTLTLVVGIRLYNALAAAKTSKKYLKRKDFNYGK